MDAAEGGHRQWGCRFGPRRVEWTSEYRTGPSSCQGAFRQNAVRPPAKFVASRDPWWPHGGMPWLRRTGNRRRRPVVRIPAHSRGRAPGMKVAAQAGFLPSAFAVHHGVTHANAAQIKDGSMRHTPITARAGIAPRGIARQRTGPRKAGELAAGGRLYLVALGRQGPPGGWVQLQPGCHVRGESAHRDRRPV